MDGSVEYTAEGTEFEQGIQDVESLRKRKFCDIKPTNKKYEIQELSELCSKEEWYSCKKPQGHDGFLPWSEFLEYPKSHPSKTGINEDAKTFDYLKTSGALVVRLAVGFVSRDRPEELYKSLFKHRETHHTFLGSGSIIHLDPSVDRCRCCKCTKVTEYVKTWNVYISTVTHVVFDHTESVWTTAELFYDSENRTSIKRVCINCVEERSILGDTCVLKGVTCDEKLSQDLSELLTKKKKLYDALPLCERPTAVVISHPHGMHKHISWGYCQVADTAQDQIFWMNSYKYKTTTCPGSSGAPVLILNDICSERHNVVVTTYLPCHSGANSEGNYSGEYHEPTFKIELDTDEVKKKVMEELCATRETNFSDNLEADLHKHVTGCKKNPGHKGFIPIKEFHDSFLPDRYRDSGVMLEYIKTLAALTFQCKTKFTSLERPEFYPGTQVPYPCYNDRGSDVIRLGTGVFNAVVKQNNSFCTCEKCLASVTPSREFYVFYVTVSKHCVFDDSESRQTQIVLGFDDNKSLVTLLEGWTVLNGDIEGDWTLMRHITCDLELSNKLSNQLIHLSDLERQIHSQHFKKDTDNLIVIVGHPHGCPKQVSVGKLIHKHQKEEDKIYDYVKSKIWYSVPTCPGSSGSPVFVAGKEFYCSLRLYIPTYVHSDCIDDTWNKSGNGIACPST